MLLEDLVHENLNRNVDKLDYLIYLQYDVLDYLICLYLYIFFVFIFLRIYMLLRDVIIKRTTWIYEHDWI